MNFCLFCKFFSYYSKFTWMVSFANFRFSIFVLTLHSKLAWVKFNLFFFVSFSSTFLLDYLDKWKLITSLSLVFQPLQSLGWWILFSDSLSHALGLPIAIIWIINIDICFSFYKHFLLFFHCNYIENFIPCFFCKRLFWLCIVITSHVIWESEYK